ncbi:MULTISPECIES: hypothetical protein [Halomicrobium]|nr:MULTISPECIES: hypothetical protein [Halomicrobium]QCD64783.1 hypothetical protein E5139_03695 [Halomicrobium mukohataei]QFR19590.1 hypothetical protein GBQ70_03695 [Halomicrobium sp. ZPS1]
MIPMPFLYQIIVPSGYGRFPLSVAYFFMFILFLINIHRNWERRYMYLSMILIFPLVLSHPFTRVYSAIAALSFSAGVVLSLKRTKIETRSKAIVGIIDPYRLVFLTLLILSLSHIILVSFRSSNALFVVLQSLTQFGEPVVNAQANAQEFQHSILSWPSVRDYLFVYFQLLLIGMVYIICVLGTRVYNNTMKNSVVILITSMLLLNIPIYIFDVVNIFRFTVFFWPIAIIVSAPIVSKNLGRKLLALLIVVLVVSNIAGIYPHMYDNSLPSPSSNVESPPNYDRFTKDHERAVTKFTVFKGKILANDYYKMLLLTGPGEVYSHPKSYSNLSSLDNYDWFLVGSKDSEYIYMRSVDQQYNVTNHDRSNYQSATHMLKVYENGNSTAFKIPS